MFGSALAISIVLNKTELFLGWVCLTLVLVIIFAVKTRSILKSFYYILCWFFESLCLVLGFIMEPHDPNSYPTNVIIIKAIANKKN